MGVNSRISKAGMRSRKPTGSLGLMAGAGKRSSRAVSWREKIAETSSRYILPGSGSLSLPAGTSIVREGHGTGDSRGEAPGEVHDTALKAAETDATKRALATFGKPFGLELYRAAKPARVEAPSPAPPFSANPNAPVGFHPDDTTPIPRPSKYYGRRQSQVAIDRSDTRTRISTHDAQPWASGFQRISNSSAGPHRQERLDDRRAQASS